MNIKQTLSNKKGFSIAEISVAILLLVIFVSLIVVIFNNVYLSFVNSKRNSIATMYATQILEKIETMLYEEVTILNLNRSSYLYDLNIPDEYKLNIRITPNTENTIKIVDIEIYYVLGNFNNIKKVNFQKIKTRDNEAIPNQPEIYSGMVPVKYDANLKSWVIASSKESNWYNYYNKQWANVMLLDGLTTEDGIEVTEENKEDLVGKRIALSGSMFVWIPRYAYKIDENQNTVEVEFLYGTTNKYLDNTTNSILKDIPEEDGYVIPESFQKQPNTAGQEGLALKGLWISKYPAGYQESTISINEYGQEVLPTLNQSKVIYSNVNYSSCNLDYITNALGQDLSLTQYSNQKISYPVFRNLTYAYNLISISDAITISEKIAQSTEFYGLNSSRLNSRIVNNNEWDAVVYLANSKYGNAQIKHNSKNLNNSNNNIYSVTGYSTIANDVRCSSTNNMSGVFDLNGCIWEHTYNLNNGYYKRGGSNIDEAGVFDLYSSEGEPNVNKGFRVVLIEK